MNGDIGIALRLPERNDDGSLRFALRVAFPRNDGSGGVRFVLPSRLVEVDTVFAMTCLLYTSGGFGMGGEVDASPALARVYPDFDRLLASGEFAHWAEQLYAPLLAALGRGAEEQA